MPRQPVVYTTTQRINFSDFVAYNCTQTETGTNNLLALPSLKLSHCGSPKWRSGNLIRGTNALPPVNSDRGDPVLCRLDRLVQLAA